MCPFESLPEVDGTRFERMLLFVGVPRKRRLSLPLGTTDASRETPRDDVLPSGQPTRHLNAIGVRSLQRPPEADQAYEDAVTTTVYSVSFSFRRRLGQISSR